MPRIVEPRSVVLLIIYNTGSFDRKRTMRGNREKTRARKAVTKTVSFSAPVQMFPVETEEISCRSFFTWVSTPKGAFWGQLRFSENIWHAQVLQPLRNRTSPLPDTAPSMSGTHPPTSRFAWKSALHLKNNGILRCVL